MYQDWFLSWKQLTTLIIGQSCGSVTAGYLVCCDSSVMIYNQCGWKPCGLQLQRSTQFPDFLLQCCVKGASQASYCVQHLCSQDQPTDPHRGRKMSKQSPHQALNSTLWGILTLFRIYIYFKSTASECMQVLLIQCLLYPSSTYTTSP